MIRKPPVFEDSMFVLGELLNQTDKRTPPRTFWRGVAALCGLVTLATVAATSLVVALLPGVFLADESAAAAVGIVDHVAEVAVAPLAEPSVLYVTDPATGKQRVLATIYDQYRIPVTLDEVSPHFVDALLSSEDPTFFENTGIDLTGIARAALSNTISGTHQGASTITQQYVKNVKLQECANRATSADAVSACWDEAAAARGADGFARKLAEAIQATRLTQRMSKTEILTGYINTVSFGGNIYGIGAAAERYFGTSAAKLTIPQAATLAGMVQSPNALRIDRPKNKANGTANDYTLTATRRGYVLDRMLADGKITPAQHDRAAATPITPHITPLPTGCEGAGEAAYFCRYVVDDLLGNEALGATRTAREQILRRGGLKVYTTLDPRVLASTATTMHETVPASVDGTDIAAAGVQVQVGTGRILALTQNTTYTAGAAARPGQTGLVYAGDHAHGGSIGFPVGSAYKLFTLVDWLESGRGVYDYVNGVDRTFTGFSCDGTPVPNTTFIGNFNDSYGYWGTPMAFTRDSLNSGYLAMAEQLNLCDINRTAERFGLVLGDGSSVTKTNDVYDVLGSKAIAPVDMASAYAAIAAGGVYCPPTAVDKVVGREGTKVDLNLPRCRRVTSKAVAATAAKALAGVMTGYGTGVPANPGDGTPLIGKTGTHGKTHTMLITSSTKAASAVWVGNADGGDTDLWHTYVHGIRASDLRYGLARNAQSTLDQLYGGGQFPYALNTPGKVTTVEVPDLLGKTVAAARKGGSKVTTRIGVKGSAVISSQHPAAGGQMLPDTRITVETERGKR